MQEETDGVERDGEHCARLPVSAAPVLLLDPTTLLSEQVTEDLVTVGTAIALDEATELTEDAGGAVPSADRGSR